jgi:predicted AAA+ superfamily ATPase
MMVKLGKIKCVIGDPGHALTRFMLIVKFEGELLVMIEKLITHISFHQSTHDVSLIVNKCVARRVNGNQAKHKAAHHVDLMKRGLRTRCQQICRNVSDA